MRDNQRLNSSQNDANQGGANARLVLIGIQVANQGKSITPRATPWPALAEDIGDFRGPEMDDETWRSATVELAKASTFREVLVPFTARESLRSL